MDPWHLSIQSKQCTPIMEMVKREASTNFNFLLKRKKNEMARIRLPVAIKWIERLDK